MTYLKYDPEFRIDPTLPVTGNEASYGAFIRLFVNSLPELSLESQGQGIRVIDAFVKAETEGRVSIEDSTLEWLVGELKKSGGKIFKGVVTRRLLDRLDETVDSADIEVHANSHDAEAALALVGAPGES